MEEWKAVTGYEGYYEISDLGNVRSVDRAVVNSRSLTNFIKSGKILKKNKSRGYNLVMFSVKSKTVRFRVGRLVGLAFIPNPLNKKTINHKNGIRDDDRAVNLEWNTYSENSLHSFRELGRKSHFLGRKAELSITSKPIRCTTLDLCFPSVREASKALDVDASTIIKVCKGQHIATKGLSFVYT